jgi:cytochrome c oxidase subunit 2
MLTVLLLAVAALQACAVRGGRGEKKAAKNTELVPSGSIVDGVRVVKVAARRYQFTPKRIVVREGENVRLEVTSSDVTHGMAIRDFGVSRELPKGKTQEIAFTADKPGRHEFHCFVFCGLGHGKMKGEIVVLAQ